MSKVKKKKTLKVGYKSPYAFGDGHWAFVNKVKGGFRAMHQSVGCKDWAHELIADQLNECPDKINNYLSYYKEKCPVEFDKLRFVISFSDNDENLRDKLYRAKRYINATEKRAGWDQTKIRELNCTYKNTRTFVVICCVKYIESPPLMHWVMATLRSGRHYAGLTKHNMQKVIAQGQSIDCRVMHFVDKHDVAAIMMVNHHEIMKGLTLKDIYPTRDTVKGFRDKLYHSNFGMYSACRLSLASVPQEKRLRDLFAKHNIPTL